MSKYALDRLQQENEPKKKVYTQKPSYWYRTHGLTFSGICQVPTQGVGRVVSLTMID